MSTNDDAFTTLQPGERAEHRVALLADTQNLYYAARDEHGAHVDYERLLAVALRGRTLAQASAYVVEREGDRAAFPFITKLSALGYRVHRRTVRVHRSDDEGRLVLEGDWDLQIAADMVRTLGHVDVIVLASGDGDFVPMVKLAQERGVRVEVAAFRTATSQALADAADRVVDLSAIPGMFVQNG